VPEFIFLVNCRIVEEAEILQIEKNKPLFILERYTYTGKEEIMEYSKFIMKQENASYYLDISLELL